MRTLHVPGERFCDADHMRSIVGKSVFFFSWRSVHVQSGDVHSPNFLYYEKNKRIRLSIDGIDEKAGPCFGCLRAFWIITADFLTTRPLYVIRMMIWCFTSLLTLTLLKSNRDNGRVIMKGSVQRSAVRSWAKFHLCGASNPWLRDSKPGALTARSRGRFKAKIETGGYYKNTERPKPANVSAFSVCLWTLPSLSVCHGEHCLSLFVNTAFSGFPVDMLLRPSLRLNKNDLISEAILNMD